MNVLAVLIDQVFVSAGRIFEEYHVGVAHLNGVDRFVMVEVHRQLERARLDLSDRAAGEEESEKEK